MQQARTLIDVRPTSCSILPGIWNYQKMAEWFYTNNDLLITLGDKFRKCRKPATKDVY